MSFFCGNYEYESDQCLLLKSDCIPGRPGCVLAGRIKVSEDLQARIDGLREKREQERPKRKKAG